MVEPDDVSSLLRRLDLTERNVSDQARTLTALTVEGNGVRSRLDRLEEAHQERRVKDAEEVAREKAMQVDIAAMKSDINAIKGTGSKALWIFIAAILLAFAGWILKGGLA